VSRFDVELTDTFSGEANYSWVRRTTIDVKTATRRAVMRAAKRAAGLSGVRGTSYDSGDMLTFRPHGQCVVLFVTGAEA
jgi:hypothetical protein